VRCALRGSQTAWGYTPGKARACAGIRPVTWAAIVAVSVLAWVGIFALVATVTG